MTGLPAVLLLLATATGLISAAIPPVGSAAVFFGAMCAITAWRQHAKRNQTGEQPRRL